MSERDAPVIVGISLRSDSAPEDPPRQFQNAAYLKALERAGAVPLLLPTLEHRDRLRALFDLCDCLLLPGGPDVDPELYGEQLLPDCKPAVSPALDATERALLDWAREREAPVLAVCRGIQVLNVYYGGTLWQDLLVQGVTDTQHRAAVRKEVVHRLSLAPGSRLAELTGPGPLAANSLHHQGIRDLAPGLTAVAWSEDGLVEGVEDPTAAFVVGVQCHPEELVDLEEWPNRLFAGLVGAAAARRDG